MADRGGVLDYDANGNHVLESVTAGGVTLTTRTVYDAMRRVVRVTGPDGLVTKYEYDAAGRMASVTNAFGTENAVKTVNVYILFKTYFGQ